MLADTIRVHSLYAVLLQPCWWRVLATITSALQDTAPAAVEAEAAAAPPAAQLLQHPSKYCLPYHLDSAYGGKPMAWCLHECLPAITGLALHVLLVAELWDVWPWQLAQLQQLQADDSTSATGTGGTLGGSATRSSSAAGASGDGQTSSHTGTATITPTPAATTSSSSSSRSSQGPSVDMAASLDAFAKHPREPARWEVLMYSAGTPWPLLPDQGMPAAQQQEGQGLPPVTLQQLQLAVGAMSHAAARNVVSAALLLSLLLQRAEPDVRASFLAGPGGSALLAACQYWGHCYGVHAAAQSYVPGCTLVAPTKWSARSAVSHLLTALHPGTQAQASDWGLTGAANSFGLLLAWSYLVPAEGWEVVVSHVDAFAQWLGMVTTLFHTASPRLSASCMPGECARCCLPHLAAPTVRTDSSRDGTYSSPGIRIVHVTMCHGPCMSE
jgi:hypothetical protein